MTHAPDSPLEPLGIPVVGSSGATRLHPERDS